MIAALANRCWRLHSASAGRNLRAALARPQAAQDALLAQWLVRDRTSAWGRLHGFAELDPAGFRARHPITDWDEYRPWIERIAAGEAAVLSADPVHRFLPTSGSSSDARKLIPGNAGLQGSFATAVGCWMQGLATTHPQALRGRAYWSLSPPTFPTDHLGRIPIGFADDGEYLGRLGGWLARATFAVPTSVARIADPDAWRTATCLHLLRCDDLSLISVWSPGFLTLLWQAIVQDWDRLLADPSWTQHRRRQRDLARLSHPDPRRIWPRLALISCWTHGSSAEGATHLASLFPGVPLQPKGLVATEAIVSIPWQTGMDPLLAITAQVVEFEDADGRILGPEDVVVGQVYGVVVSNGGGLWRYRLGDLVEITGRIAATPTLRFLARSGGVSDRCGEKLHPAFAERCARAACDRAGLVPTFLLLVPEVLGEAAQYRLFIESGSTPTRELLAALAEDADLRLAENPHYAHCRRLGQLGPLRVTMIAGPSGTASAIHQRWHAGRGQTLGDIKPAVLLAKADWSTELPRGDQT